MIIKLFLKAVVMLPGNMLNKLLSAALGSYKRTPNGHIEVDTNGQKLINSGILGHIVEVLKILGLDISNTIYKHRQIIGLAFWTSLLVANITAFTLTLFPGVLATLASLTIAGISIVSLVGSNTLLQLAVISALFAAATNFATYVGAAASNAIHTISSFVTRGKEKNDFKNLKKQEKIASNEEENLIGSANKLRELGSSLSPIQENKKAPFHHIHKMALKIQSPADEHAHKVSMFQSKKRS